LEWRRRTQRGGRWRRRGGGQHGVGVRRGSGGGWRCGRCGRWGGGGLSGRHRGWRGGRRLPAVRIVGGPAQRWAHHNHHGRGRAVVGATRGGLPNSARARVVGVAGGWPPDHDDGDGRLPVFVSADVAASERAAHVAGGGGGGGLPVFNARRHSGAPPPDRDVWGRRPPTFVGGRLGPPHGRGRHRRRRRPRWQRRRRGPRR